MTRLEVINMALGKCGLPWAASMADANWHAVNLFDQVARQSLRMHAWSFALRYEMLVPFAAPPAAGSGWSRAYHMPEKCLRLLDIRTHQDSRAPLARFSVVEARGTVYTNANPANARYVYDMIEPDQNDGHSVNGVHGWTADFADAMATALAGEIAPLAAQSFGLGSALKQMAAQLFQVAIANDADEEQRRVPLEPHILFSR